ncbi:MAG TPA: hypothetical protein VFN97_15400 [Actinospica sp.]|nr:hypothetical protein [Actinospica sp.]
MSESAYERCADCPATVIAEPVPVLGPFIGLVGAVLCGLAGALLLLAPFAFDYRQGAGATPRSSVVDLATGGCVLAVGLLTTLLFGGSLRQRLRASVPVTSIAQEPVPASASEPAPVPEQPQPRPEPAPQSVAPVAAPVGADPGGALRDLLTPLVAALAADLRARDSANSARVDGMDSEGRQS